jgi:hypothetical protein
MNRRAQEALVTWIGYPRKIHPQDDPLTKPYLTSGIHYSPQAEAIALAVWDSILAIDVTAGGGLVRLLTELRGQRVILQEQVNRLEEVLSTMAAPKGETV